MSNVGKTGKTGKTGERGPRGHESIHPWRWRLLTLWIVVFSLITFWIVRQNRESIHDLRITKANLQQLQNTNCALHAFLFAASQTRLNAAAADTSPSKRKADIRAARSYTKLANTFDGHSCKGAIK